MNKVWGKITVISNTTWGRAVPRSGAQQTPRAVGLIKNPTKKKGTKTQFENTSGKYRDTQVN